MRTHTIGDAQIELIEGDISRQRADAIVNAANRRLGGGGGVDGAIHRAGGPTIMAESRRRYPNGCEPGHAVETSAGDLDASYVIHAVGPIYHGGQAGEAGALAGAYRSALELAARLRCETVALPALSTGAYAYPLVEAATIAMSAAVAHAKSNALPRTMRFVLFNAATMAAFEQALANAHE